MRRRDLAGPPKRDRGASVDLPQWWLDAVNRLYIAREDKLVPLGQALALAVGREKAWPYDAVSRFLANEITTRPMADAFCRLYGVPPFVFEPRSMEEAIALQGVARKYDPPSAAVTPEQQRRLSLVDQRRVALEEEADRHTEPVTSQDESSERVRGSGRTGRSPHRRPPSSRS